MLKCPSCDTTLEQDFGIVTCSNCKSMLMVDDTGKVQLGTADIHAHEEITEAPAPLDEDTSTPPPELFDDTEPEAQFDEFDPVQSDFDDVMDEDVENDFEEPVAEFDSLDQDEESGFDEVEEDEPVEESFDEPMEDPLEDQQEEAHFEPAEELPQDFSMATEPDSESVDITEFANSEVSSLEDGEFLYSVTIKRLDSKDLKEALKYILLDDKLKINHHEYMKKIKDGQVIIPHLNPIKAKRIVEQLQYYDLDISWEQIRVVMETVEPDVADDEDHTEVGEDVNL